MGVSFLGRDGVSLALHHNFVSGNTAGKKQVIRIQFMSFAHPVLPIREGCAVSIDVARLHFSIYAILLNLNFCEFQILMTLLYMLSL